MNQRPGNRIERPGGSGPPGRPGFTLVELLVAMAITVVLMGILFAVSRGVLSVSSSSHATLDADQRARAVMDSIEADLKDSLNQYGYTVLITSTTYGQQLAFGASNTQLTFLTRNRGPAPSASGTACRCVAVSYWLATTSTSSVVMRSYCPIYWGDTNPMLTAANTVGQMPLSYPTQVTISSTTYNSQTYPIVSSLVADNVLRLEAVVNLDDGAVAPLPQSPSLWASVTAQSPPWLSGTVGGAALPNGFQALQLTNWPASASNPLVCALTIAVAALDSRTSRLPNALAIANALAVPSNVSKMPNYFPSGVATSATMVGTCLVMSGTSTGWTPYGVWSREVLSGSLAQATSPSYPPPAIAALRMVENTFRLK